MENAGPLETIKDERPAGLRRSVGFYGLMFVSLGSIIGSGWLLGALNAAQVAGPASILSWVLAACMLALLALTYAELGATYPVAGGAARFPYYSHGPIVGFTAGWASWLQAAFIAPIEVLAVITYVNSVGWVNQHFNMINKVGDGAGLLNELGLVVAIVLMVLFTTINLAGAKFLSDSNEIVVIWKTAVLILAVAVGAGWLAKVLIVDAVISPAGTGVVYVATAARLSYALGEEREMPTALATTNRKGVPVVSILVATVVGCLALGPFKSWSALVSVITAATAIMYAFAPVSLAALHKVDGSRPRSYRVPVPALLLPAAFCSANLIIYWGGFGTTWKLACAIGIGLALFSVGALRS